LALEFHSQFFLPYGLWRIDMNEEDLRDCFAMFALLGIITSKNISELGAIADLSYNMADQMMYSRKKKEKTNEENSGIAAVVPKRTRKR
jgi:hypothetical protein